MKQCRRTMRPRTAAARCKLIGAKYYYCGTAVSNKPIEHHDAEDDALTPLSIAVLIATPTVPTRAVPARTSD